MKTKLYHYLLLLLFLLATAEQVLWPVLGPAAAASNGPGKQVMYPLALKYRQQCLNHALPPLVPSSSWMAAVAPFMASLLLMPWLSSPLGFTGPELLYLLMSLRW
jgi:hypothetical protein